MTAMIDEETGRKLREMDMGEMVEALTCQFMERALHKRYPAR